MRLSPFSWCCSGWVGMVGSYTIGGLIRILLVIAIVMFLVRIIAGRRVV